MSALPNNQDAASFRVVGVFVERQEKKLLLYELETFRRLSYSTVHAALKQAGRISRSDVLSINTSPRS